MVRFFFQDTEIRWFLFTAHICPSLPGRSRKIKWQILSRQAVSISTENEGVTTKKIKFLKDIYYEHKETHKCFFVQQH